MKQVDLVEILRSRETYDKDHPTISIYDALEAMKEACNQAIELCAEKADWDYYDSQSEIPDGEVFTGDSEYGYYSISKRTILNTKKQII